MWLQCGIFYVKTYQQRGVNNTYRGVSPWELAALTLQPLFKSSSQMSPLPEKVDQWSAMFCSASLMSGSAFLVTKYLKPRQLSQMCFKKGQLVVKLTWRSQSARARKPTLGLSSLHHLEHRGGCESKCCFVQWESECKLHNCHSWQPSGEPSFHPLPVKEQIGEHNEMMIGV